MHVKYEHKILMFLIFEEHHFYFLIYNILNIFFLFPLQINTLLFPCCYYPKGNKQI